MYKVLYMSTYLHDRLMESICNMLGLASLISSQTETGITGEEDQGVGEASEQRGWVVPGPGEEGGAGDQGLQTVARFYTKPKLR